MADLRNIGILPIYVNARESFDQADMAFADVVLVLAEAVVRALIYFLSPADQHSPTTSQIDQLFQLVEVPVLPIRTRADAPAGLVEPGALAAIKLLLDKRIVLDELFADPESCVETIARWSGGRLRDIIDLTRQACEFAHFDPQAAKVERAHVDRAARKLAARRLTVMTPSCCTRGAAGPWSHDRRGRLHWRRRRR